MRTNRGTIAVAIGVCILAGLITACGGGSGSGGSGGGGGTPGDTNPPIFYGARAIATAGGAFVRLDWDAAQDDVTPTALIAYRVYLSTTSAGHAFGAPAFTTTAGATHAVLDSTTTGVAVGQAAFYVVRAVDGAGNEDVNEVELGVTPVPTAQVAFVSNAAGGPGALGDPTDPFTTLQAGVTAVEGAGGGAVLVDAAGGGSTYAEEVDLTVNVTQIGLFGGFARFSTLPAAPSGGQILDSRDLDTTPTTLSASGLFPLGADDLVHIDNGGALSLVDGFTLTHTYEEGAALAGTLELRQGDSQVLGTGTSFTTEILSTPQMIRFGNGVIASVDNVNNDTELDLQDPWIGQPGATTAILLGDDLPAIRAIDARLQVSGCELRQGAHVFADTTAITGSSSLRIVGNRAIGLQHRAFVVGGGIDLLRFQGNVTNWIERSLDSERTASQAVNVPGSGCDVYVTHNILENNRVLDSTDKAYLDFAPANPASGGDLMLELCWNETRNTTSDAMHFEDLLDLGDGGSLVVSVHDNLFNGTSSEDVYLGGLDLTMYANVGSSIDIRDNQFLNSNGNPVEIDTSVAAGATTTIRIEDNLFGVTESEMVEIDDEEDDAGTVGVHDGGILRVDVHRNVAFGGAEDIEVDLGFTQGGRTTMSATENTLSGTEDPCLSFEGEERIGETALPSTFPDGIVVVTVFNNDLEGEEPIEIDDKRGEDDLFDNSLGIYYVGHNTSRSDSDGSDGAIELEARARWAAMLVERNFTGGGGQDTSEAGIELDSANASTGSARILNNIATMASGGGITMDPVGVQWQVINNTIAYGAQTSTFGLENDFGGREGDLQAYILNCIASHNGGGDAEEEQGVRPLWSLIRDQFPPTFTENLDGEPFYAKDLDDVMAFGEVTTNAILDGLFTLLGTSPAVDAGHPDVRFNDPDGTRNDMGAFGGPNAGPIGALGAGVTMPFVFVGSPHARLWTGNPMMTGSEPLWLTFNKPVQVASLAAGISITSGAAIVTGTWAPAFDGHAVTFTPDAPWPTTSPFVEVAIGTGTTDTSGQALAYACWVRFAPAPAATAEAEPNDDGVPGVLPADLVAAQALGAGPASAAFRVAGAVADGIEIDTYEVTVNAFDRLSATIVDARAAGGTGGGFEIHLYDASGRLLVRSRYDAFYVDSEGDSDPYLDHTFDVGGTYYLVVFNEMANAYPASYDLQGTLDK